MTRFHNVVLALDLSLSSPGFAVLAETDRQPILLEVSHVKTDAKTSHGARLAMIATEIERLITLYNPQYIVREKGFSRFPATTQALFKVVGMSDYVAHLHADKAIDEIPVTTVKKAVTGSGKSDKDEVAAAVFRILQIENTADFYRQTRKGPELIDDRTDACAVGIAYLKQEGLIV